MSTGEFISERSVSKKGIANIQAVFLPHKDFGKKACQRKRRLWNIKDVEQRLRGGLRHDLNHKKKPDSNSQTQPSLSTERQTSAESLSGTAQIKKVNKALCGDETQPEFTPIHGFSRASAEQDQAALSGELREERPAAGNDTFTNTEVNKEDSPQNLFGSELALSTDREEVTASHLENERESLCQSPNALGSHASPLDLKEDTHTVIIRRHAETGDPYAQYTQKVIQIRVTEFTVPGTVKKAGHDAELTNDPSAKSKSVCQPIICKILDETEDFFPLSQNSDSSETELQACSPPDMLTSSVMTAFAPNWSARSRKQKQGVPDANLNNTREQEMQRRRQDVPSSSLFSRDFPQQPLFGDPKLQTGNVFPEVSNKENAHSVNGSKSSADSFSNLFNLRNHGPGRRRVTRAFSAKMAEGQTNVKTEVAHPVDTVLRPVSPHSLDLQWSRSASQPAQFYSMNPPPTNTSSLLLSFNSAGAPPEKYPLSSTSSFNLDNKNVPRMSEPLSYVTLQRNRKSLLNPSQPPHNTANRPKGASEYFPLSASPEERQQESLRPRMFLYPETSSTPTTSDRGQTPASPLYNKLDGTKNMPLSPTPGSMLRRQQTLETDSLQQSSSPRSFALRRTLTLSNVSDFLNNNSGNRARTMLAGDSSGSEAPAYSSGIYSGMPRPYDSYNSSNLNTLASHTDASMQGKGPQIVTDFSMYTRSHNSGIQQAKTVDIPTLSRRSKTASTSETPETDSPTSPRGEYSVRHSTNLPSPLRHSTNAATLVQQNLLNTPRPLFNRETYITNTQHSISNIDKNRSPIDRPAVSPIWQKNVEDLVSAGKQCPSSQTPCESPDPLSPARSKRNICAPTTFTSLRRNSPASPTSSLPPSKFLFPQTKETPVTQPPQDRKVQSDSSPVHVPTTFPSVRLSSPVLQTSPTMPSSSLMSQRRETPVSPLLSQNKNIRLKQPDSSPVNIPTTVSSSMRSSPVLHASPTTPSSLLSKRRETPVPSSFSQEQNIQRKLSDSNPALTPTTLSSVRLSTSPTTPSLSFLPQRRETPIPSSFSQEQNIQRKLSESNPALTVTTLSSGRLSTSTTTPSLSFLPQRRETPVPSSFSQEQNIERKLSESNPALTPTTLSSGSNSTSTTTPSVSLLSQRRETPVPSLFSQEQNIQRKLSESNPALTPITLSSGSISTSTTTPSLSLLSKRRETPVASSFAQEQNIQRELSDSNPALTVTTLSSGRLSTSTTTPSVSLLSQRRETPVPSSFSQEQNIQRKLSESNPALTLTTISSGRLSTSPTTPSLTLLSRRRETPVPQPPQDKQTQLKRCESSPAPISSLSSKFTFDLSQSQRPRSSSKIDPIETSVTTGSSATISEKHKTPLSPYDSLLAVRQTSGRPTSPPVTQRLRSPSFDSTINTSKMGCTTHAPYFLMKFSEEQLISGGEQVNSQLKASMSLDNQGPVQPSRKQPVSATSKYISDTKNTEKPSPRITLSPCKPSAPVLFHKENEKLAVDGNDSVRKASPTQTQKKRHQHQPVTNQDSPNVTQKGTKQDTKDVTDSQSQKWSLFTSKNQRDASSREKENKPQTQEKSKKNTVVNRMDQILDRMDQMFKSFTVKYREEDVNLKVEDMSLPQKSSSGGSSVPGNQKRLESCGQSAEKQVQPSSVTKSVSGLGLFTQDQVTTKPPKPQKKNESNVSPPKVPQPTGENKTKPPQKQKSIHINQSSTLPANWRSETNESDRSLLKVPQPIGDNKRDRLQKQKSIHVNQYATLPADWRTFKVSSNPSSPMDFYTEDVKSNKYLSNIIQPRRKTTSLCESEDDRRISNSLDEEGRSPSRGKLSPCSDIKYGLNQNRSFSVSSVQSSRPSGTGRISRSSSRASSISDLTSAAELMTLDDLVTHEITVNPDNLCGGKPGALQIGPKNESPSRVWSPTGLERTSFPWENECDPTPPPSPTFSPSTRRLSHAPSSSPQGSRKSQDNISPRGHLPSKNYTCNLSVFEESDSDSTTTDDEYYLDNENGEETEL